MGAGESKIALKQGIHRLAEQKSIPADDSCWASFCELPESQEDVFNLFSPTDIRRIRDEAFENLETLLTHITSYLFYLARHGGSPDPALLLEGQLLNCIRILTRILPYIYEAEHLETWEERFFWTTRKRWRRGESDGAQGKVLFDESSPEAQPTDGQEAEVEEDAKPLAEELIDVLIDLLFHANFTIPRSQGKKGNVHFTIWQSGVGCNTTVTSTPEMENRRMEVLRLLLTLTSKSMYTPTNVLPVQGVRAITYVTTIADKQLVLTLLCSLLNTTIKYNPATWRLPYDHVVFKEPKQLYVTYCLQLLLVLVLYPVPEAANGVSPKNYFRHFLGRLHRPQDFQFMVDGMTRILNQPMQATASILPGSQKSVTWAPEMIMLFWEMLQCNKRFRSFIVDTDRAHDFVVSVVFYAMQDRGDMSKQGLVRMCIFVLQTLSAESSFSTKLNKPFHGQETLPQAIRIPHFRGTYADFLIISIYSLITSSKGKIDAVYPALLAIINNIAPHAVELSSQSSSKLMQLFATMASPTFLLANDGNHQLLQSLLEAINAIIEHQYDRNTVFIFAVLRAHKRFYGLRDLVLEGGQTELDRQQAARKQEAELSDNRTARTRDAPTDGVRSSAGPRAPLLSDVAEEGGTFAIGDDEDSDDEQTSRAAPQGSVRSSRAPSIAESTDDFVPAQIGGMSEKARGKMRVGSSSFSRVTSNASLSSVAAANSYGSGGTFEPSAGWIDSWLAELPLHTTLTVLDALLPQLPNQGASGTTSTAIASIRAVPNPLSTNKDSNPIRVHLFEWSPLSLGWYESLLWSFIFSTEMTVMKGAPGTWRGTQIKLFRVQEMPEAGPTLMQPQGAVDAVGSSLVKKIGSLGLSSGLTQPRRASGPRIRDV